MWGEFKQISSLAKSPRHVEIWCFSSSSSWTCQQQSHNVLNTRLISLHRYVRTLHCTALCDKATMTSHSYNTLIQHVVVDNRKTVLYKLTARVPLIALLILTLKLARVEHSNYTLQQYQLTTELHIVQVIWATLHFQILYNVCLILLPIWHSDVKLFPICPTVLDTNSKSVYDLSKP